MSETKTTLQFSWPFINATKSTIKPSMAKIRLQHTKASGEKNEIVQINKWHGKKYKPHSEGSHLSCLWRCGCMQDIRCSSHHSLKSRTYRSLLTRRWLKKTINDVKPQQSPISKPALFRENMVVRGLAYQILALKQHLFPAWLDKLCEKFRSYRLKNKFCVINKWKLSLDMVICCNIVHWN